MDNNDAIPSEEPKERFNHPATDDIYKALDNYAAAEALLKESFESLQEAVLDLPYKIGRNAELRDAIITHLFWNEKEIRQTWLAKAFNSSPWHIRELAAQPATIECRECNRPMQVTIKSRSGEVNWHETTCEECKRATSHRNDESYRAYFASIESRRQELREMPYKEYLQTPEWQERRKKAMKRAGFRCQVCNAHRVRLNTHHRTYERRGNEKDSDLIVLCENCHGIFHENGTLAREN